MLLQLSRISNERGSHTQTYINTKMIVSVEGKTGRENETIITLADKSKVHVFKPVEEVMCRLTMYDKSLIL